MMKLGCMSLSYQREFTAGTLDLERFIDRAHQLRLDGIDLHTHAFASQDPAYLRSIRMRALKKGIALSYIGGSSNFGGPAGEKLDEQVATAKHWIDVAQFMGIPLVRVFAAWVPGGDTEAGGGAGGKGAPSLDFSGSIAATAHRAVHVRCKIYRIQTGVEAWLDYPRIFKILRSVDYNGWCSVVYEGQDVEAEATAVPKAVTYLRGLMAG